MDNSYQICLIPNIAYICSSHIQFVHPAFSDNNTHHANEDQYIPEDTDMEFLDKLVQWNLQNQR